MGRAIRLGGRAKGKDLVGHLQFHRLVLLEATVAEEVTLTIRGPS